MKNNQWLRLIFYIALNVLVSACTTLVILIAWERLHPNVSPLASLFPAGQTAPTPQPTLALDVPTQPAGDLPVLVQVENVFGVGIVENEVVRIQRIGEGELSLTNWQLVEGSGERYTFPALVLYAGGAVQIHSTNGTNTVTDLYWMRSIPAWSEGEMVTLLDDQGRVRATYQIP